MAGFVEVSKYDGNAVGITLLVCSKQLGQIFMKIESWVGVCSVHQGQLESLLVVRGLSGVICRLYALVDDDDQDFTACAAIQKCVAPSAKWICYHIFNSV